MASRLKGKILVALNPAAVFDGFMAWNHALQKSSEKQYFVSFLHVGILQQVLSALLSPVLLEWQKACFVLWLRNMGAGGGGGQT